MVSFLGLGSLPSTRKSLPSWPTILLEPWEPKIASLPEPPTRLSSPLPVESLYPPNIKSLPVPPSRLSVPRNPMSVLLPSLPTRLSSPLVPLKVSGPLERVMNSIRNGLGMGKTEIAKDPSRAWNPHFYAVFAQVHNTL